MIDYNSIKIEWLIVLILALVLIAGVFVWSLLKAAEYPAPTSLVVSLSILTFIALSGAWVTASTELATLAATGFGAIAGAVSSQFGDLEKRKNPPVAEEEQPPTE